MQSREGLGLLSQSFAGRAAVLAGVVSIVLTGAFAARLTRNGTELRWDGQNIDLAGSSDYHVITAAAFDRLAYLDAVASYGINFQRMWICGYSRVGEGTWMSGELQPYKIDHYDGGKPIYDLTQWNQEYFDRLHAVAERCFQRGIIMQITLFDHWSLYHSGGDAPFSKHVWHGGPGGNNINNVLTGAVGVPGVYQIFSTYPNLNQLGTIEKGYVRKIANELKGYDNVLYEIMNEARDSTGALELRRWHYKVAEWIKEVKPSALVNVNPGEHRDNVYTLVNIDVVALHYGEWEEPDYGPDNIDNVLSSYFGTYGKPIIIDDDGAWGDDGTGHPIRDNNARVNSWANAAISHGGHFNHKDSITDLDTEALTYIGAYASHLDMVTEGPVEIDLGTTDVEKGLQRVVVSDGHTMAVTVGGKVCRRNADPGNDHYMYFDAADSFVHEGDHHDLYIAAQYYDSDGNSLALQYDSDTGSDRACSHVKNDNTCSLGYLIHE